jgi:hypothetical protein
MFSGPRRAALELVDRATLTVSLNKLQDIRSLVAYEPTNLYESATVATFAFPPDSSF